MEVAESQGQQHHNEHLTVQVRYSSATKPFVDPQVNGSELLAAFRTRVMKEFNVTDEKLPDGGQKIFFLYREDTRLENLNQTMGDLAGEDKHLKLKLVETVIQG